MHIYYAGKTHHDNFHNRADSRGAGNFATGMDGKELAIKVSEEETHKTESEAIQFLIAFFNGNRQFVGNNTQVVYPFTGWVWDNEHPPTDRELQYWYRKPFNGFNGMFDL